MAKKSCECEGVELFIKIVDTTIEQMEVGGNNPDISVRAFNLSQKVYDHLLGQANKPENKPMYAEANTHLEKMRKYIGDHHSEGMLALDAVRDAIHKFPALQQLMVCGGPYKIPEDRTEAALVIGKACNMLAATDDDVHPILNAIHKKLGCSSSIEEMKSKLSASFR